MKKKTLSPRPPRTTKHGTLHHDRPCRRAATAPTLTLATHRRHRRRHDHPGRRRGRHQPSPSPPPPPPPPTRLLLLLLLHASRIAHKAAAAEAGRAMHSPRSGRGSAGSNAVCDEAGRRRPAQWMGARRDGGSRGVCTGQRRVAGSAGGFAKGGGRARREGRRRARAAHARASAAATHCGAASAMFAPKREARREGRAAVAFSARRRRGKFWRGG